MPECDNCDSHVTEAYHRVFSVGGVLRSCLHCTGRNADRRPAGSNGYSGRVEYQQDHRA